MPKYIHGGPFQGRKLLILGSHVDCGHFYGVHFILHDHMLIGRITSVKRSNLT
jgi:hypothetical protein